MALPTCLRTADAEGEIGFGFIDKSGLEVYFDTVGFGPSGPAYMRGGRYMIDEYLELYIR